MSRPRRRIAWVRAIVARGRLLLWDVPDRVERLERDLPDVLGELRALRDQVAEAHARLDGVPAAVAGLRVDTVELRDTLHLVARRNTLRRDPVRVLFLVHLLGAWDALHAVVEAMAGAEDFEPVVVSVPRRFRGSDGLYGEPEVHRGLEARGVPHLRLPDGPPGAGLALVKAVEPDIVFRQSQWDADVADELATARLGFARTCLVPYETMNVVVNLPDGSASNSAVDSAYHRAAWLVFCTNALMHEIALHDGQRGGAQFRVVGHPKADHLRAARPVWPLSGEGKERPGRVVWSAHHSIGSGWTDFGAFPLMCADMLAWARERDDVEFVFMPHPALLPFPDSDASPISRADFDAWTAAWAALPNTAVLSEADYAPTLAASDVMITDGLSMLVEYQLVRKPIVFVERAGHRPFNLIGEKVVRGVHRVQGVDVARRVTEKFLAGEPDPLRELQEANVEELFGAPGSADRIVETLRREIARERGG